jgi:hypothetical protein
VAIRWKNISIIFIVINQMVHRCSQQTSPTIYMKVSWHMYTWEVCTYLQRIWIPTENVILHTIIPSWTQVWLTFDLALAQYDFDILDIIWDQNPHVKWWITVLAHRGYNYSWCLRMALLNGSVTSFLNTYTFTSSIIMKYQKHFKVKKWKKGKVKEWQQDR